MKRKKTARYCAADILRRIVDVGQDMGQAFAAQPEFAALDGRDRNFCRLLVSTTLRRLGEIDALLAQYMDKPLPQKLFHVKHCLRLGAAQLLFLHTPPHAAVHDTVELLAADNKWRGYKGLVNAVLKRVARDGHKGIQAIAQQDGINLPAWLWQSWVEAYGTDNAAQIAHICQQIPPLDISVKQDAATWAQRLGGDILSTGSVRLQNHGAIEELDGFTQGEWWVQDAAAAIPAKLLGNIAGKTTLDLCAAPGGKTAQLAAMGARVTAVERSPGRITTLEENMARLNISTDVEIIQADIMKWHPDKKYEVMLLDAPCSATGTLRRHPDVAWHRTPEDITRMAKIQRDMLERSLQWLTDDGILLYCVCSLQPQEGEEQISAFLASHPHLTLTPIEAQETGGCDELLTKRGELRTLPCNWHETGGMDGFYAARMRLRA